MVIILTTVGVDLMEGAKKYGPLLDGGGGGNVTPFQ